MKCQLVQIETSGKWPIYSCSACKQNTQLRSGTLEELLEKLPECGSIPIVEPVAIHARKPAPPVRGITVCVNYDDTLQITLPRNARHFSEIIVVTDKDDARTAEVVRRTANARLFITNAFYHNGAKFNRGLALEKGFNFMGRSGWICIFDADTLLPAQADLSGLDPTCIYNARRHMLHEIDDFSDNLDWSKIHLTQEWCGYFQMFHANDPHLCKLPWYGIRNKDAGWSDTEFQKKWPRDHWKRPNFNVLHLGLPNRNWSGRVTPRVEYALPDTPQQMPKVATMAASYAKALAGWIQSGMPERSEEEVQRIYAICKACPIFDQKRSRCRSCGCRIVGNEEGLLKLLSVVRLESIFNKARMFGTSCFKGKW